MRLEQFGPILVGVGELGAGLVYLYRRQYHDAIAWIAWAIACFSLGTK